MSEKCLKCIHDNSGGCAMLDCIHRWDEREATSPVNEWRDRFVGWDEVNNFNKEEEV